MSFIFKTTIPIAVLPMIQFPVTLSGRRVKVLTVFMYSRSQLRIKIDFLTISYVKTVSEMLPAVPWQRCLFGRRRPLTLCLLVTRRCTRDRSHRRRRLVIKNTPSLTQDCLRSSHFVANNAVFHT